MSLIIEQVNNSLDYLKENNLLNDLELSEYVFCKKFLGLPFDEQAMISHFNSIQQADGGWLQYSGLSRMFTTSRIIMAYYLMNAKPAIPLDSFLSGYDTWAEVKDYSDGTGGDLRNVYHIMVSWVLNYWRYPPWLDEFFSHAETDLSWTTVSDYHKRTHILYTYVFGRKRKAFPNLDGIINTTINSIETDPNGLHYWSGSQYSFMGPVYFTGIQISLLSEILRIYPGYRTAEITTVINATKPWINSQYATKRLVVGGIEKDCGYWGDVNATTMEASLFSGILCAGQSGILPLNIDMSFEDIVGNIRNGDALPFWLLAALLGMGLLGYYWIKRYPKGF